MLFSFSGAMTATNGLFTWSQLEEAVSAGGGADGGGGWSDGNEPGEQPPTSGIDIGDTIIHPPRIVSGVLH